MKTKIMDKIFLELYLIGKESNVERLRKETLLKRSQIYNALRRLNQRGLIIKRKILKEPEQFLPPMSLIYVKVKNIDYAKEYLKKRGLI